MAARTAQTLLLVTVIALVVAYLNAKIFFVGAWVTPALWAVAGIAIGLLARSRRSALQTGAWYGFVLSLIFLLAGRDWNTGTRPLAFVLFTIIGSLLGALCGAVFARIGSTLFCRGKNLPARSDKKAEHSLPFARIFSRA